MKDSLYVKAILYTAFFSFLAHGFSWFDVAFNHDSLKVFQLDGNWQAYLGRFLIPAYLLFRGKIVAPLLVAFLSVLFLSLSVVLTVRLLDIKRTSSIILVSALFATCPVLTSLYSTYMSAADIQMLSLLFSVFAVCLTFDQRKYLIPVAIVFLAISIALYQAYAQVFLVLAFLRLIKDRADGGAPDNLWKNGAKTLICFVCGSLIYYLGWVIYVRIAFDSGISQLPSSVQMMSLRFSVYTRMMSCWSKSTTLSPRLPFTRVVAPLIQRSTACSICPINSVFSSACMMIFGSVHAGSISTRTVGFLSIVSTALLRPSFPDVFSSYLQ